MAKTDLSSMTSTPSHQKMTKCQLLDSIKKAAFVVGTAALVFVAARNSITWHLQRFWGASGDFWQRQWDNVLKFFNGDEFLIGVFGTTLLTMAVFWLLNSFLVFLDMTGWPAFLLNYKIQADKNVPVDKVRLWKAVKRALFNQTVVGIPFSLFVFWAMKQRGCTFGGDLPTFHWVLLELVVFTLIEELGFYYSHRLLHHPVMYKHIHKIHHEWTAPISIVSIYSHPLEHAVSNMLPPILGPILMQSHLATIWMWLSLVIMSTTVAHCGYHLPFLPSPEAHDFHHLKFNQNFGVLGVLDRLHGTDNLFRNSPAYQRHILLLSLVPISQKFSEPTKKTAKME